MRKYLQQVSVTIKYILLGVIIMVIPLPASTVQAEEVFNILVIQSYHVGHYWESFVLEGFEEEIKQREDRTVNIKVEYLDFRKSIDPSYLEGFIEFLELKYPKGSVDAIYAVDDEAFSAMSPYVTNKESVFYHTPLFFNGVDSNIVLTQEEEDYIAGIFQRDITLEGFNLMLQIDDKINCIIIVTEKSGFGNNLVSKATNIVSQHLENEIELVIVQEDYIQAIHERLESIAPQLDVPGSRAVLLLGGEFQDEKSKNFLDPSYSVEVIQQSMDWPIYISDPTYLEANVVGGCVDIGQLQGKEVARMMGQIIDGGDMVEIESNFAPAPKWILKYPAIYAHELAIENIPSKCMIIDKKPYQLLLPKNEILIIYGVGLFGLVAGVMLVAYSIKMASKLKRQAKEKEEQLQREQLQSAFIANMSHELRTPINLILAAVSVIKLQVNQNVEEWNPNYLEKRLDTVSQNAYRLLKLANNIIDITKIEAAAFKLNRDTYNIVEVIEHVFEETVDYAHKKSIEMVFDTYSEEIIASVDCEAVQRIILNLLSNAIKFTPEGGMISLLLTPSETGVSIEIKDTGIGIPADRVAVIFDRFYQVDNSLARVNEGSGIGLSIVKELVSLHGGTIEVESAEQEGTTIVVNLPLLEEEPSWISQRVVCVNTVISTELSDVVK